MFPWDFPFSEILVSLLLVSISITITISSLPFADTSKTYLLENFIEDSIVRGIINKIY